MDPSKEGKYVVKASVWYGHEYVEVEEKFDVYLPLLPMIIVYLALGAVILAAVGLICAIYYLKGS